MSYTSLKPLFCQPTLRCPGSRAVAWPPDDFDGDSFALIASAVYSMPLESSARSLVPATGTQWPYSAVIKARGASCARAAAALKWDEGHRYRSVLRLIGGCETQDGDQHIGRVGKIEEGASTLEGGALQGLAERFIGESAADQLPPPPPPNDRQEYL